MNGRSLLVIAIGAVIVVAGIFALGGGLSATGGSSGPAAASGSTVALATSSGAASAVVPSASAAAAAASVPAAASPAPSCTLADRLVAMRATGSDGFPVKVAWTGLGPAGEVFLTLSDVSPTIPIAPAGPATLIVGLTYASGGDRFALTANSVALVYDPATGAVTGDVATGYGKNSNRATTDTQPSHFSGTLIRPSGGQNGSLTGTITHAGRRDYAFTVGMTEKTIQVASGPGCSVSRPSDTP